MALSMDNMDFPGGAEALYPDPQSQSLCFIRSQVTSMYPDVQWEALAYVIWILVSLLYEQLCWKLFSY